MHDSRIEIETTYEKDWDYAKNLLRALAWYHDCNMVVEVQKEVETWSERSESGKGTHYYKVAKYIGVAVRKA